MHIAFNGWFWDQPHTGSGQYIRRLLHYLRKVSADLQMTLVLPPHNQSPDDLPHDTNIIITGDSQSTSNLGKIIFEQRTFPQMAERVEADIAHIPYWGPPLRCKARLVTSVLDVIPLMYPDYTPGLLGRLYTALVSAGARGSGHIITISETAKLDIENHLNIPENKITATYLATDDVYHPRIGAERDEAVREKYDLPERFVLYLGGFDVRKQVNELLLAYTYVSEAEGDNIPLILAGKLPAWGTSLFPNLPEYADQLNISDYVRWIGYVDEADKPSIYRLADVFVFPSENEGFGLPPLEAMACGTAVVAFNTIIFEEILEEGAFLVEDARVMAGAIIALLLQGPFRETMINQGLAQVTKYSWRKTALETLRVYERVMQNG